VQFIEQFLRLLQVERVKAFDEAVIGASNGYVGLICRGFAMLPICIGADTINAALAEGIPSISTAHVAVPTGAKRSKWGVGLPIRHCVAGVVWAFPVRPRMHCHSGFPRRCIFAPARTYNRRCDAPLGR
jgi:hypothetical protein